jgi:hypothetical protein
MKTRTLLLLSVGVALAILLAGGVFLFQLANETAAVEPAEVGETVTVGDVEATVRGVDETASRVIVDLEVAGVDDDLDGFVLVTGDRRLDPVTAPAAGRCTAITVAVQRCGLEFDVSAADGSSRVLVLRRGDEQRNWVLTAP